MASVRAETVVDSPPAEVWAAIADVGAVHLRLLPNRVTAARIEGDERVLTMPDGTEVHELIVAVDHERRRLAYSVQGPGRLLLRHHHAAFQVHDHDGGARTRLVWTTDVLPHSAAPAVQARVTVGIEEMRRALESAA